ncbi:protein of unknown function [Pilibacter termitis]|uniref:Uncharacterized protein n=1 Tax=Pilibacter termitis TaxID=263852 RepID=A0A1T4LFM2_9ENTE|nr:DUF916 and DUF3324 domain-containing protein [Pilibacter termitis]SJZ53368.1 protein of unknown function [Pilibacter termitis]
MLRKKLFIVMSLFLFGGMSVATFAEEGRADTKNYSVQKVDSGGAVAKENTGYFDLLMKPGEKRTIVAEIKNSSENQIVVDNQIHTAFTNSNGEIAYNTKSESYDESLKIKMSDIAKVNESDIKAEVEKKGTRKVRVEIEVPENAQKGVILGSWFFDKEGQTSENDKQKGVAIQMKYTYTLGIKITIDSEIATPHIDLTKVTVGNLDYRKAFFAHIQNDQPAIMGELLYEGEITEKGKYDVLYKGKLEKRALAPNSTYAFPIFLGKEQFEAGDYTFRVKVTSSDPKWKTQTWEFSKNFTILADEAVKHNKEALNDGVPEKKEPIGLYVIIGGLVFLVLVIFIVIFIKRKGREKQSVKEYAEEKIALLEREKRHKERKIKRQREEREE